MKAHIVLGMQFGDEGKGRTVDYLTSHSPNPIVVRFSGGQNCGHTVVKDGIKHIFGNFGSGTLRGAPSYFSEHCCIYLNAISREKEILEEKGFTPDLYVHPLTKMTTPYDIVFNQILERKNNHGSCGVGIGTTMKRHLNTGYKLHAMDLKYPSIFEAKLLNIKNYYIALVEQSGMYVRDFLEACELAERNFDLAIKENLFEIRDYDFLTDYEDIIFEGSQGILLDMDHGFFPNVTYANTTSKNAIEILKLIEYPFAVNTYYITRCYQTRHGNGWMSNQEPIELINNEEEINVLNQWQGMFKIGELDYNLLNYALEIDNQYNPFKINKNLVITCLDQRPDFSFDYTKLKQSFGTKITFSSPSNTMSYSLVEY